MAKKATKKRAKNATYIGNAIKREAVKMHVTLPHGYQFKEMKAGKAVFHKKTVKKSVKRKK